MPRAHHGRLPQGSEIKLAGIGQGTAARPLVEVKLWHPGELRVEVIRAGARKRHAVGGTRRLGACELAKVRLPYIHGTVVLTARAFGAAERRTISF